VATIDALKIGFRISLNSQMRCINPKFETLNSKQYLNPNGQNLIAAEFFYNSPFLPPLVLSFLILVI